jgi:hypothetical protein
MISTFLGSIYFQEGQGGQRLALHYPQHEEREWGCKYVLSFSIPLFALLTITDSTYIHYLVCGPMLCTAVRGLLGHNRSF